MREIDPRNTQQTNQVLDDQSGQDCNAPIANQGSNHRLPHHYSGDQHGFSDSTNTVSNGNNLPPLHHIPILPVSAALSNGDDPFYYGGFNFYDYHSPPSSANPPPPTFDTSATENNHNQYVEHQNHGTTEHYPSNMYTGDTSPSDNISVNGISTDVMPNTPTSPRTNFRNSTLLDEARLPVEIFDIVGFFLQFSEDMSNEEVQLLVEQMSQVDEPLSDGTISRRLKTKTYVKSAHQVNLKETATVNEEPETCVICQVEYDNNQKIGTLACGHEFHEKCIRKWLHQKNDCPLCRATALPS